MMVTARQCLAVRSCVLIQGPPPSEDADYVDREDQNDGYHSVDVRGLRHQSFPSLSLSPSNRAAVGHVEKVLMSLDFWTCIVKSSSELKPALVFKLESNRLSWSCRLLVTIISSSYFLLMFWVLAFLKLCPSTLLKQDIALISFPELHPRRYSTCSVQLRYNWRGEILYDIHFILYPIQSHRVSHSWRKRSFHEDFRQNKQQVRVLHSLFYYKSNMQQC